MGQRSMQHGGDMRAADPRPALGMQILHGLPLAVRPYVLLTPWGQTQHWWRAPQAAEPSTQAP